MLLGLELGRVVLRNNLFYPGGLGTLVRIAHLCELQMTTIMMAGKKIVLDIQG